MTDFNIVEQVVTQVTVGDKTFATREEAEVFVAEQKQKAAAEDLKGEINPVVEAYLNSRGLADRKRAGRANAAFDFMVFLKTWDEQPVERTVFDKIKEEAVVEVAVEVVEVVEVVEENTLKLPF